MKWKNLKGWQKGAMVGGIVGVLITIFIGKCLEANPLCWILALTIELPILLLQGKLFGLMREETLYFLIAIINILYFVIIGIVLSLIIGFIIDKVKKK